MARWRLTEKHYLNTDPPTEWEHVEQSLLTGEVSRVRHKVQKYLDPENPRDQNHPGMTVVCHKGKGEPRDIVFVGPPSMGMEPLDEEAEQLSAFVKSNGEHPIESMPTQMSAPSGDALKFMQSQINTLMLANDELQRRLASMDETDLEVTPSTANASPKVERRA